MNRLTPDQPLHRCLTAFLVVLSLVPSPLLQANPAGEVVIHGDVQFDRSEGQLRVLQASDRAIIDWESFSIGAGQLTEFVQPNSNSAALNRVRGASASQIEGMLRANGKVYLLNPNGILIGPNGSIDVGGFAGSTLDVSDQEFRNGGDLNFAGASQAAIVNLGSISALNGDVILIAASVSNDGTIKAPRGTAALAAGNDVLLAESGSERVFVRGASGGSKAVGANNSGSIEANIAELKSYGGNIYGMAVKNEGRVAATGVTRQGGQIFLSAKGGRVRSTGTLKARKSDGSGGKINVDSGAEGKTEIGGEINTSGEIGNGGEIRILGREIEIFEGTLILNDGETGGGNTYVGGSLRGLDPEFGNAEFVTVGDGVRFSADALSVGNGGQVVLFAEDTLRFQGEVSATGGAEGGNGGFAELSGKNEFYIRSLTTQVDLSAGSGKGGTLLLDPTNVNVVHATIATSPVPGSPLTANSVTDFDINAFLVGNSLEITTDSMAMDAGDITINGDVVISWASSSDLTFTADQDFIMTGGAIIESTGGGAFSATATRSISMGNLSSIQTANGDLTLEANLAGSASGNFIGVDINNATVKTTGSGSLTIYGKGGTDNSGSQFGVRVWNGGDIIGGTTGSLIVEGTGGTNTGSNNFGVLVVDNGSTISSSGGNVSVTGMGGGGTNNQNMGVRVSGGLISAGGIGNVTVVGTGGGTAAGQHNGVQVFNSGKITSSGGNVSVTGTGGTGNGGFSRGVLINDGEISAIGTGTVSVTGTGGTGGADNFGVFISGTSPLINTDNREISVTSDSLSIASGSINSGTATTTINTRTNGTLIDLGGADVLTGSPLTLGLTDAELDRVTAGTLQIGNTNSGAITVSDAISRAAATNLNMTTGGSINFSGSTALLDANGGNVTLNTNTVSGAITSGGGSTDIRANGVTLTGGAGGIGSNGNPLITDATSLSVTVGGNGSSFLSEIDTVNVGVLLNYLGSVNLISGTFRITPGGGIDGFSPVFIDSAAVLQLNGTEQFLNSLSGSGSITNASATDGKLNIYNQNSSTFSGVLGGSGTNDNNFSLTTENIGYGPGGTLTLSGANTYTGGTTVNFRTLKLGSASALGSTSSGTTVADGAVLDLNGQSIGAEAVTLNGTGISSGGALINSSGSAASLSGNITLASASSIGGSGNATYSGTVNGGFGLTLVGAGTKTFSGIVGGSTALTSITQNDATGAVRFNDDVSVGSGGATFNANVTLDGLTFTSGGAVSFGNAATDTLTISGGATTVSTTSGDVTLNSTTTGNEDFSLGTTLNPIGGGINFSGAVTMSADKDFEASASGLIQLSHANADLSTSGTGAISLTTTRNITLSSGSSVVVENGNLTLSANILGTEFGNFSGITVGNGSLVESTGTGTVNLTGKGGVAPTGDDLRGVEISGTIRSATGAIDVSGTGGGGTTGEKHNGIRLQSTGLIESTGTGSGAATITLTGIAGSGSGDEQGIAILGDISSINGDLSLTGTGGASANGNNKGIHLFGTGSITSTGSCNDAADIILTGYGSNSQAGDFSDGIGLPGGSITSIDGDITLTGRSYLGNNVGIRTGTPGTTTSIAATGSGAITITAIGSPTATLDDFFSQGTTATFVSSIGSATGTGGITITADTVDLAFVTLQNSGDLRIRPEGFGVSMGLGGETGTLNLNATELANLTNGFNSIQFGNVLTGQIRIGASTFYDPVSILGGTNIYLTGQITGEDNAAFTFATESTSTTFLNADVVTDGNMVSIIDDVVLGANVIIDTTDAGNNATGANVEITGNVTGSGTARNFTIQSGTGGAIVIDGNIGSNELIQEISFAGSAIEITGTTNVLSNVDFTTNALTLGGNISSSNAGTLRVATLTGGTTIGIGTNALGALHLNDSEIGYLQDGFSSIEIGSANAGDIQIEEADFNDPVDFISGEDIEVVGEVNGDEAMTFTGNNITVTAPISTSSGALTFNLNDQGPLDSGTVSVQGELDGFAGVAFNGGNGTADTVTYSAFAGTVGVAVGQLTGIEILIGNGSNSTFTGPDSTSIYTITGENDFTLGSLAVTNFANLTAGSNVDFFNFQPLGSFTGTLDGGTGSNTIDFNTHNFGATASINFQSKNGSGFSGGGGFENIDKFIGRGSGYSFTGPDAISTFNVTGTNDFNFSGIYVTDFANLTGGSTNDVFSFGAGSSLSGVLDGGLGSANELNYSTFGSDVSVNFETGATTAVTGGFLQLNRFVGSGGSGDSFTGHDDITTYLFTGADDFNFGSGANYVVNFANLTGGSANDIFSFGAGSSLTGSLDGGGGSANELLFSSFGSNVSVNFQSSTASPIGSGFSQITRFVGSGQTGDTFTGSNTGLAYSLSALNTFSTTEFEASAFENLYGGSAGDQFLVSTGAGLTGQLNGGSGLNTLNYSSHAGPVSVNIGSGEATGLGGFSNVTDFVGSASQDTLQGTTGSDSVNITSNNTGTVNGNINFASFEILKGGSGNDFFNFLNQATVSLVDGGSNYDTLFLDDSNLFGIGVEHTYTITSNSITRNPVYNFANIEHLNLLAGEGDDTINSGFFPFSQSLDSGPGFNTLNLPGVTNLDGSDQIQNVSHLRFAAPRTLTSNPGNGNTPPPPTEFVAQNRFNSGNQDQMLQQLMGNQGGFAATTVIGQGVIVAIEGNSYLIFRAISLDGSGLNPSDAAAAALSDNLSVDANVELAGAIGYTGIVLLFMRDGAYCIDLSGAAVDPVVLSLLQSNLGTAASLELYAALEMAFVINIIDADGAVTIDFEGNAPGQPVIVVLAEQLSDASFNELSAALADGN